MTRIKSAARASATKSVVLHKQTDARLLERLRSTKTESDFWRAAAYFYLDFMAWLAALPPSAAAPPPNQPFIYYRAWLEQLSPPSPSRSEGGGDGLDPESIAAAILPGVRSVVEAALSTALANISLPPINGEPEGGLADLADLFAAELVLD